MPFRIAQIPVATRSQMLKLEELAEKKYGISALQQAENAGRSLAEVCRRALDGSVDGRKIVILCGSGNKGSVGLCAARYLANWGSCVNVVLCAQIRSKTAQQYVHTLQEMEVPIHQLKNTSISKNSAAQLDLCVDALLDYSATGPPDGALAKGIQWINRLKIPVVSLDVPSGLDCDTGKTHKPFVRADFTVTLGLPKPGLMCDTAKAVVGKLFLADVGLPPKLLSEINLDPHPIFIQESIIALDEAPPNYFWQQCPGIFLQK
ncbi:MAG: NAD(P)H-hydrate epimerase [Calditrichaeota bacterium]|nr:MAG: NAD(P)H-hydrate epimerase [Calditrichota bacterium]